MKTEKVGIILKRDSATARRVGDEMITWFSKRQVTVLVDVIEPDMDFLVILGGDGTLLHVAARASEYGVPVMGVNLGNLGFLTEVARQERYQALEQIMAGSALIEKRMMLKSRLSRHDQAEDWRLALNDVVISKGAVDRLVRLSAWVGEEFLATYKADGLIFSTPTGSTAYNLSAGGPIVHPDLASILLTPICPFMLESRPVLLSSEVLFATRLADQAVAEVEVIVDGQPVWLMGQDDVLEVAAAEKPLLLISSPRKGYFDILRRKLNWGGPLAQEQKLLSGQNPS